jgi:hypothetical protein
MTYSEKLKDPRWQRKRLEILQRDEFMCQKCGNGKKTLHVHHKSYRPKTDPWDYPDYIYITLCEDCHKEQHGDASIFFDGIREVFQEHYLATDIWDLWVNLYCMETSSFDGLLGVMSDYAINNAISTESEKEDNG